MTYPADPSSTRRVEARPAGAPLARGLRDRALLVTQLAIGFYAVESLLFGVLGQLNSDEGWYLYASRMVLAGMLPYRDFAFTQMPLFPYVYGVAQGLGASVLLGRLTSVVLSAGTLSMSIAIARKHAGAWAAAYTALLFAAFAPGLYFNTVVKTYALVAFLFTATLLVLSLDRTDAVKYPLAVLFGLAAALVRVTASFFILPVFLYALMRSSRWTRLVLIIEGVAAVLLAGYFLFSDWASARWGLFSSHLRRWGNLSTLDRLGVILSERVPDILQSFGPLVLLGAAAFSLLVITRSGQRDRALLLVTTAGLTLFALSHLVNGIWAIEYLVPALYGLLPIIAIGLAHSHREMPRLSGRLVSATIVAGVALLMLAGGAQYIVWNGKRLPLVQVDQVAAVVRANSKPGDRVIALEALAAVLEADRQVLPGLALAQFSLQNVDTSLANQLHVVNTDILINAVNQKTARLVILTEGDWGSSMSCPRGASLFAARSTRNTVTFLPCPNSGNTTAPYRCMFPRRID